MLSFLIFKDSISYYSIVQSCLRALASDSATESLFQMVSFLEAYVEQSL